MSKKMMKRIKGFTLIELMIVVAIIGILAAVAIPKFADLVTKSKEATVKANLGSVRSATNIYYGDNEGTYPSNLFTALATGGKYLPSVSGVDSLGKFDIPRNNVGNIGHTYGNLTAASFVTMGGAFTENALYYNNGTGDVLVSCSHLDTRGNAWSGF